MTTRRSRPLVALALFAGCAAAVTAADVVILKDGFVIQGKVRKETESVPDKATGQSFTVPRAGGFDLLDDGPRLIVFSSHAKQLGEISTDQAVRVRPA